MNKDTLKDVAEALGALATADERRQFLTMLLTPRELDEFENRWIISQYIAQGMSQREIQARSKAAIATVSRVAHAIRKEKDFVAVILRKLESGTK